MGPTRHQGAPRGWSRPVALWVTGGPPLVFLCSSIFIYFIKNLCEVSGHLELCRIGVSVVAFSGREFQLPAISLSM